ncbi:cytochrome b6-f complex subunit PetM [Anthocerotibacter panamensis]|nr:PetM family cytochrome b6-f complex subunit 7 [Anthocerotibacter panamensis]
MGELFTTAGIIIVFTLVGMAVGFAIIKLRGEVKE